MQFTESPLPGAFVVTPQPQADARGMFARTVCEEEFAQAGLDGRFVQQSVSWNPRAGTLRGMHYQRLPYAENKLVRVTRGVIFDVIVDLRPGSATLREWFGIELSADNRLQLYVPKGFAHGFQTLQPDTEVFYQMTEPFQADSASGFRWDDSTVAIKWPEAVSRLIGERDLALPFLDGARR
jgi:dTDP-4-dehydrorhamnose 3,5-epimerase